MIHLFWFVLLLAGSSASVSEPTGLTFTTRISTRDLFGGTKQVFSSESTVYLQGDRKRTEYPKNGTRYVDGSYQPSLVNILRCDLHKSFRLNMDTREYEDRPYGDPRIPPTPRVGAAMPIQGGMPSGLPTIRIETDTKDTGERKEMFGHTARHVITTIKSIPVENSQPESSETVMDGWYTDLNTDASCENLAAIRKRITELRRSGKASSNATFVETGEPETGFVLQMKMISKTTVSYPGEPNRVITSETDTRVTKFEEKPLDPALFEIPDDFHWVYSLQHEP
jgi:hypothetical protein